MAGAAHYLDLPLPRPFAHRGWHLGDLAGMENSLSALRAAVEQGYRYLEIDVQASVDGQVFVHHDATLDRTTDRTGVVAELPAREVGRALIGGREPVALLAAVLQELPTARLNIDIKTDLAVEPTIEVISAAGAWHRVGLASFSGPRLKRIRHLAGRAVATGLSPAEVRLLWLDGKVKVLPTRLLTVGTMAQVPVRHGNRQVVTGAFVRAAHRAGVEVHVWTVDDRAQMAALLDLGVDGLVTDRPDLLKEVLQARRQWG